MPVLTQRELGLIGKSKSELRAIAREMAGADTTHLGDPPAIYPEAAHEGDRVTVVAKLCCSAPWLQGCEGYAKFIMDGVEHRIPSMSYSIPRNACRWTPGFTFTMPDHDVTITIEPWEEDFANPDDKGDPVDITIRYLRPDEHITKDPLDSLIFWFESKRPVCPIGPLESLVSGTANFVIKITPDIPILPG